jgi:hypothetical protein
VEPGDGSWLKTREGSAVRTELRERMLTLAVDLGITSVAVVWDRGLVDWSVNEVQVEILRWVYERISMCLPADEVAVVIADEPGGDRRDQREWLAETLELTDHGTEYVTPDRVVLPIVTTHPITCRTCSSPTWWWARPRPRWPATATRLSSLRCSDSSLTRTPMATRWCGDQAVPERLAESAPLGLRGRQLLEGQDEQRVEPAMAGMALRGRRWAVVDRHERSGFFPAESREWWLSLPRCTRRRQPTMRPRSTVTWPPPTFSCAQDDARRVEERRITGDAAPQRRRSDKREHALLVHGIPRRQVR